MVAEPHDDVLCHKVLAVHNVCHRCCIPPGQRALAVDKTLRGHREHNDAATLDVVDELRAELADITGYAALALLRTEWSWRLWVVAWLSGVAWRVLR